MRKPDDGFDNLDDDNDELIRRRTRPRRSGGPGGFVDFLLFRAMLTPVLIQALFWAGTLFCVAAGVITILTAIADRANRPKAGLDAVAFGILVGLAQMVLGPVLVRVYCEVMIIFFRIHEELCDLHRTMTKKR